MAAGSMVRSCAPMAVLCNAFQLRVQPIQEKMNVKHKSVPLSS
jgi:hypothetical protein